MARTISGYVDGLGKAAHSILREGGRRFLSSLAYVADDVADDARFARRIGNVDQCHASALDAHARNRALPRVTNETDAALRSYLTEDGGVWARQKRRGTVEGMLEALARLGYSEARVITGLDLELEGRTSPPPFGGYQGFFYIQIGTPNDWSTPAIWNDGTTWNDGETQWDLIEPYQGAGAELRKWIRAWKPVGTSCRYVAIRIGSEWATLPVAEAWEWSDAGSTAAPYIFSWATP